VDNLIFAKLKGGDTLKPQYYKSFTLFWQAYSSICVCNEAFKIMPCDVFIDTTGVGFAYPFVKLLYGVKLASYTHYPIVSYDMLKDVINGVAQFNNSEEISNSRLKSFVKKIYYVIMTVAYSFSGLFVDKVAANSSWTYNHMI